MLLTLLFTTALLAQDTEPAAPAGTVLPPLAEEPDFSFLEPDIESVLDELIELMKIGIETPEPNTSFWKRLDQESLFNGSYDWHSNLIAHWSLLVLARLRQDAELLGWVRERVTDQALAAERDRVRGLERKPSLYPYGHAWLAMFLSEFERHVTGASRDAVRDFRQTLESDLLDWLETAPFPEVPARNGREPRFAAHYRSWLYGYLLVRWSDPITEGAAERLDQVATARLEPQREKIAAIETGNVFDFLWLPGVLSLVDRLDTDLDRDVPAYPVTDPPELPESVSLRNVHQVGYELCRIWPYADAARRGDDEAYELYNRRMLELLDRSDLWKDDFVVVSHWVPQFLWIGIWVGLGRP